MQVLLGEGYYAERTSKQAVEILKRRGKALDSQVDSLKAMMDDLKAEASFFDATASEAAVSLDSHKAITLVALWVKEKKKFTKFSRRRALPRTRS